jgi:hypothetical protein
MSDDLPARRFALADKNERRAILTDLRHGQGLSASRIGAILERSRNSILGLIDRLDVAPPARPIPRDAEPKPPRPPKPVAPRVPPKPRPRKVKPVSELIDDVPTPNNLLLVERWRPLPGQPPVALMDHREGMCRWSVEPLDALEHTAYFCGAPTYQAPGADKPFNYCQLHHQRGVNGLHAGQKLERVIGKGQAARAVLNS